MLVKFTCQTIDIVVSNSKSDRNIYPQNTCYIYVNSPINCNSAQQCLSLVIKSIRCHLLSTQRFEQWFNLRNNHTQNVYGL